MGDEIGVCIHQSPRGSTEVPVVLLLVGLEECRPLIFEILPLEWINCRIFRNREQVFHYSVHLRTGDFHNRKSLCHLGQGLHIICCHPKGLSCLFELGLSIAHVSDCDRVVGILESEIELILADDPQGADCRCDLGLAVEAIPEEHVRGKCVSQYLYFRELTNNVHHSALSFSCFLEGEFIAHVIHEVERVAVLNDFELVGYHVVRVIISFTDCYKSVGNLIDTHTSNVLSAIKVNLSLLYGVIQSALTEHLFHVPALLHALAYLIPCRCSDHFFSSSLYALWSSLHWLLVTVTIRSANLLYSAMSSSFSVLIFSYKQFKMISHSLRVA